MSSNQRSLSDVTLGDMLRGLARYRPFAVAVAAIVLAIAFLPGKPHRSGTSTVSGGNVAAGPGSEQAAGAGGGASAAGAAGPGAAGAGAGSGRVGAAGGQAGLAGQAAGGGASAAPTPTTDPACDQSTGRLKIPSLYAPPCVPPFSGDNGGSTYQGVTATSITMAVPYPQQSAAAQAILTAAGDNDNQDQRNQTTRDYINFFEHHFQTYGRKINLVFFQSNVNPNDSQNPAAQNSEAQADALHVAKEIKAFASLGDAGDPYAFHDTLVANKVMCVACTTTLPSSWYLQRAPYVWGNGLPDETQDYSMRAEVICDEINPFPPQWVGGNTNPETSLKPPALTHRVYGLLWPEDPSNSYKPGMEFFVQRLKDECGVTVKTVIGFPLTDIVNAAQAQQDSSTDMARFASDGDSSVIFVGDPITPVYFTSAATRQQYFPEWIQTGSALTDTAIFGRVYDQQQWVHNFGFSALADRVPQDQTTPWKLYTWQFNHPPPAATEYYINFALTNPLMTGIMLAGPNLTPQSFQCGEAPFTSKTFEGQPCVGKQYPGMFGYPVSPTSWKTRVTNAVLSWGDHLWQWDDYNQTDDGTLIWWDPNAQGPAENNAPGKGLFRYVNNGSRYMYGQFPKGAVPWFNPNNTQTVFAALPAADQPPNYQYACYYLCNSPGN
ncbi:MAG TPA: hypothetical protein VKI64_11570 [Acidimicrobiales bacterium]|nr:hypothetical protein [Acidimicrobiales bacterium]